MPSVDVAMARSVRGGVGGIIARSLQAAFEERSLEERDIATSISSVKDSFSSWDNCMAAVYCKWPVIALMIIAGLIVFSVIWCIARCLCCGLSCCCECCHCLKCCGQCCGCCDPPNGRRRKHLDEPYNNIPDSQGYKREDPMAASALPFDRPRPTAPASSTATATATSAKHAEPPQYASFDVSKKHADGSDDDLPAMPVWGDSESKKIQLKEEAVELQQLKPPEASAPLMNGMSPAGTPGTRTPVQGGPGPYGVPGGQAVASGYFANVPGGAPAASPYNNNVSGQGYNNNNNHNQMPNNPYGQSTTSFHTEQSWGITPGPMPMGQGPQRPQQQPGYGPPAGYAQEPAEYGQQPPTYNEYGAPNMAPAGPNQQQGYRNGPARSMTGASTASTRSGYADVRARGSPAPSQHGGFDRGFDPRIMPVARTASPAQHSPAQQQGAFDPRLMAQQQQQQQRTGSPALQHQQGAFDHPRAMPPPPQRQLTSSPAPMQGGFDPRGAMQQQQQQRQQQPQRTASPAQFQPPQPQFPNAPARSFSPAPPGGPGGYHRGPPQRQMSADPQQQRGPYRQDSGGPGPPRQQFANSPRPGQQQRMPPSRSQTAVDMEPPRSPGPRDNFSRPMRSNTFDQQQAQHQAQQQGGGGQQAAAYPGYKPYQPGR